MLIQSQSSEWQITVKGKTFSDPYSLYRCTLITIWLNWKTCRPPSEKFMKHRLYQHHPRYISFCSLIMLQVRNPCKKPTSQYLSSEENWTDVVKCFYYQFVLFVLTTLEMTQTGHFVFKFSISKFVSYQNINCLLPKKIWALLCSLILILLIKGHKVRQYANRALLYTPTWFKMYCYTKSRKTLTHQMLCAQYGSFPYFSTSIKKKKKPKTPNQQFWLEHPGFSSSLLEVPKYIWTSGK